MGNSTILDEDDIEFIENANGQLSALEISQKIKVDLFVVTAYLRRLGPPKHHKNVPSWARVRPPAVYSNNKKIYQK